MEIYILTIEAKKQFYNELGNKARDFFLMLKGKLRFSEKMTVQSLLPFLNVFNPDDKTYLLFKIENNIIVGVGEYKAEPIKDIEEINFIKSVKVDSAIIDKIMYECEDLYKLLKNKSKILNINIDSLINVIKNLDVNFNLNISGKTSVKFSDSEIFTAYIVNFVNIKIAEDITKIITNVK